MILKTVQASVAEKFNPLSSESIWTLSDMLLLVQQIWKHFSFIPGSAFNYRDTIILNISSYEDFPPGFTKGNLLKTCPHPFSKEKGQDLIKRERLELSTKPKCSWGATLATGTEENSWPQSTQGQDNKFWRSRGWQKRKVERISIFFISKFQNFWV